MAYFHIKDGNRLLSTIPNRQHFQIYIITVWRSADRHILLSGGIFMSTNQITSKIESLLEWEKIQSALEEILDLSQPKPSPNLIRKFVSKIVPDGKTTSAGTGIWMEAILRFRISSWKARKTKPQSPCVRGRRKLPRNTGG